MEGGTRRREAGETPISPCVVILLRQAEVGAVAGQDKLSTRAHTGFLNLDKTLKRWVGAESLARLLRMKQPVPDGCSWRRGSGGDEGRGGGAAGGGAHGAGDAGAQTAPQIM